ncbi:MAG: NAD(P)H-dependent oxidoreductase [Clostridia bacterium]|nr:NAD(P)H-dependent oxidoreductase [Clostridia bacterium]
MPKILAIMGSPRKNGNTFRAVKLIEEHLKRLDPTVEVKLLHLAEMNIGMCKGCAVCLNASETRCPLKDDIAIVAREMDEADGVIFASPTYVANLTGLMKNTIDRLAYFCHRPAFYNKKAMLVTTTGSGGSFPLFMTLRIAVSSWGFKVASQVGVTMKTNAIKNIPPKYVPILHKAAEKFLRSVMDEKPYSPGISSLTGFLYNQKAYRKKEGKSFDYEYWKGKGWLERNCRYYMPARLNPFTYIIAWIIALSMEEHTRKEVEG